MFPGPGSYNVSEATQSNRKRIAFKTLGIKSREGPMTSEPNRFLQQKDGCAPPPGTYENKVCFNKKGKFPTTYVPNINTIKIKHSQIIERKENYPGPGYYQSPSDFGIYMSSRALNDQQ